MSLKYTTPVAPATVLTTEMNSLASGSLSTLSAAQSNDQSGEFYTVADAEIYIAAQGTNRAAGASVSIYVFPTVDGTNYPDTTDECLDNYYAGSRALDDAALAARRLVIEGIRLPNSDFKIALKNDTGQALAASGNTVKLARYSFADV